MKLNKALWNCILIFLLLVPLASALTTYEETSSVSRIVGESPTEKLLQQFSNEPNGVKSVLKQAYVNAKDKGVVYDLSWYKEELGVNNPFASFFRYNEKITKPSMTDNSYSLAVSGFIKEKCGSCKDVMIVGDDFVVPHIRNNPMMEKDYFNFWGIINWGIEETNIYTDSYYIQRSFEKKFSDLDEIFSRKVNGKLEQGKRVKVIIPADFNSEQKAALDKLKQTLKQKFNPDIEEIRSSSVACNQVGWFDSLKGATLVVIGTTESNPGALKCYPFYVSEENNASVSIHVDINLWDIKENAIIIGSDEPNATLAFDYIVSTGIYRDIGEKTITLVDAAVGIGAGVLVVGGVGAAIAGAPIVGGVVLIGGGVLAVGSFTNECIIKNYGGDNWGWCGFDVALTAVGGKIAGGILKTAAPIANKVLSPAYRQILKFSGINKGLSFFIKLDKKAFMILEDALAHGQLESLGKMISKLSATELQNTARYANLWDGNPFRNAKPELNLVRVFDSPNTNIVLGDSTRTIRNAAVLREGLQTGDDAIDFGMAHIRMRHLGPDATASSRFPISYGEREVIDLVSEGLEYGQKGISNDPKNLVIEYTPKSWNFPIRIVVEEKTGNLITAFPTKDMR